LPGAITPENAGQTLAVAVEAADVQSHNPEPAGLALKAGVGGADPHIFPAELAGQALLCPWSGQDLQQHKDPAVQTLLLAVGGLDEQLLAERLGQVILAAIGSVDLQTHNPAHAGEALLTIIGSTDTAIFPGEHLGLAAGIVLGSHDLKIIPEHHGLLVFAGTGADDHQAYTDGNGAVLRTCLLGFHVGQFDEHHGQLSRLAIGASDFQHHNPEPVGLLILAESDGFDLQVYLPEDLAQALLAAHGGLDLQHYVDYAGQELLTVLDFWAMQTFPLRLSLPDLTGRRIAWDAPDFLEGTEFLILADGQVLAETSERTYDLEPSLRVRQFLQAGQLRSGPVHENALRTPKDRVKLRWTGDAPSYQVWRQADGGQWTLVATTELLEYVDGPLRDGAYNYKVIAVDEEGDTAESEVALLTVSSTPEPPSNINVTVS